MKDYTEEIKPKYVCQVLAILHGLRISALDDVDWKEVAEALEAFRERVPKNRHFQEVKRAYNKIGAMLKLKVVQGSEKKR